MKQTVLTAAFCVLSLGAAKAAPEVGVGGSHVQSGVASWYSMGRVTASGKRYNPDGLTAAHRTLPFGTRVLVRHRRTGKQVHVTINDRGPFIRGRVIDLSRGAARELGIIRSGAAPVEITVTHRGRGRTRRSR